MGQLCGLWTLMTLEAPFVLMANIPWSTTFVPQWVSLSAIHKRPEVLETPASHNLDHHPTTYCLFYLLVPSLESQYICVVPPGFPPKPTTTKAPTTTPDPVASFCKGRPDGLYPNPADTSTYFQCFRGNTYVHSCQPGLVFIDSCKCCDWP